MRERKKCREPEKGRSVGSQRKEEVQKPEKERSVGSQRKEKEQGVGERWKKGAVKWVKYPRFLLERMFRGKWQTIAHRRHCQQRDHHIAGKQGAAF